MASKRQKEGFLVRHRENFWVYENGNRSGTAHLNYINSNGRRSLRMHVQIKRRGQWKETVMQYTAMIPLPLLATMLRKVRKDGPINYRQKYTFEKLRFRHVAQKK